jgi:hypothetical protein
MLRIIRTVMTMILTRLMVVSSCRKTNFLGRNSSRVDGPCQWGFRCRSSDSNRVTERPRVFGQAPVFIKKTSCYACCCAQTRKHVLANLQGPMSAINHLRDAIERAKLEELKRAESVSGEDIPESATHGPKDNVFDPSSRDSMRSERSASQAQPE